jgi:hypothetical protein
MRGFLLSIFLVLLLSPSLTQAQRYLTPQFDGVDVVSTAYGFNYTVLFVPAIGKTARQALATDIYSPKGDTETKRPLIIYFPTGNFLPFPQNTSPSGTIKDSTCVDVATKLAKMGYVVAVADYRKGWNPVAQTQEARINTLINAAYRGVQDARTAIRFFKEKANDYGIDTTRIAIWGQGTGGYITLATATLDKYSEVLTTTNPAAKFIGGNGRPFVIERIPLPTGGFFYINGDIEGKILGRVPPNPDGTPNPGPPPTGDTLNLPNWVNHSSDFKLAINMGGALGDISWLDQNSVDIISIQAPYDPFAPYEDAILFVPIPGGQLPVVQVQGSKLVQDKLKALGKDAKYNNILPAFDPIGQAIKSRQGGLTNLFPVIGTPANIPNDSSPWDFWAESNPNHANGLTGNPDMSAEKGRRYIDSIIAFVAPRACIGLELPCQYIVSTDNITETEVGLKIAPNPAHHVMNFQSNDDAPMRTLEIADMTGRNLFTVKNINASQYELNGQNLLPGMYFVKISFDSGNILKKVLFY